MNTQLYKKYVVTLAFAIGFVFMGYSQNPAPPAGPPPPVGERLPIDDYIPYLLIVAFFGGIYFYNGLDKKTAIDS